MTSPSDPKTSVPYQTGISLACERAGRRIARNETGLASSRPQFPFKWGDCWHFAVEYEVEDFATELGFFVDFMGFSLNALSPEYAMFMSPDDDVFIAIKPANNGAVQDFRSFRVCFMLEGILAAARELQDCGIAFVSLPQPMADVERPMYRAEMKSPNGLRIELWGVDERQF